MIMIFKYNYFILFRIQDPKERPTGQPRRTRDEEPTAAAGHTPAAAVFWEFPDATGYVPSAATRSRSIY